MAYSLGKAYIEVVPSSKGLGKGIETGVQQAEAKASKGFGGKLWKGLKVGAAGAGLAVGGVLTASVTKGFKRLSAIENAEAKLKGLGHSANEVSSIMDNALAAVKGTSYGMDEAASLAGTLVASGIKPGKELQKTLSLVGDSATIAGRDLDDMGLIWGSVAAKGKLQGDDAFQLLSSGVPIWQMVGKVMGKTAAEAQALGTKGQVSFEIFQKAMEQGVGGAALDAGNTTAGAFKNMNAALGRFGATLLKGVFPLIGPAFGKITAALDAANEAVGPFVERFSNGVRGIYDVLVKGDFSKTFREAFGVEEDSGLVNFLFNVRENALGAVKGLQGVSDILLKGDFAGAKNTFGFQEDSGFVNFLFTVRDTAISVGKSMQSAFASVDFGKIWGTLSGTLSPILASFKELGPVAIDAVKGLSPLGNVFKILAPVLPQIGKGIGDLAVTLSGILGGALKAVMPAVSSFVAAIGPMFADLMATVIPAMLKIANAIGSAIEPIVKAVGPLLQTVVAKVMPIVGTVVGAVKQIVSAVANFLAPILVTVGQIIGGLVKALTPLVGSLLGLAGKVLKPLFNIIATGVKNALGLLAPVFKVILGAVKLLVPVIGFLAGVLAKVADVIGDVLGWALSNLADKFSSFTSSVAPAFSGAWGGIKSAVKVVGDWITGTLVPALGVAWKAIAAAATWLWKSVITPVWQGIKVAIAIVVAVVVTYVHLWVTLFKTVLAPVFTWLYEKVIKPVWSAIRTAIGAVVSWFQNTAWPVLSQVIRWIQVRFAEFKVSLQVVWAYIKAKVIKPVVDWFQKTVLPAFRTAVQSIQDKFTAFKNALSTVWSFVKNKIIKPVVDWFKDTVVSRFKSAIDSVKDKFQWLKDKVSGIWKAIKTDIVKPVVDWFSDTVKPKIDTFTDKVKTAFTDLKDAIVDAWDKIKSGMKKPINGVIDIYNNHIKTPFNHVMEDILGKGKGPRLKTLEGFATGGYTGPGSKYTPAGVVHADEYVIRKESQNGIERQAPGFLDALNQHGPRALTAMGLGYASGGKVLHGYKEIEAIPHKGMSITSTVRKGARTAGTGSVSLHALGRAVDFAGTAQAMKDFFNYVRDNYKVSELIHTPMGGRQLSRGGIPKAHFPAKTAAMHYNHVHVGGFAAGESGGAGGDGVTNPFTGMWTKIKDTVAEKVGSGVLGGMLSGVTHRVISNASTVVEKKIAEMTLEPAGASAGGAWGAKFSGSKKYESVAKQALEMTGNYSEANMKALMHRMMQESSYNPNAVNRTDSNAAKGTPSKGLMQVIDPTFRQYAMSGYDKNIFDPLSNILAAIRYTKARYGSLTAGWNRKGGYAAGGWTGPGSKYTPAGTVHADEFVVQKSSRRSIERERPGFLDRLNQHGAAALNGYANGGLVGYASGGKVSPLSKIGSTKVTVLLDGLTGTLKQVQTAAGKLADGIVKTFNDRMKATKTATVNKLSDSLADLKSQASSLKKTISATTAKSKSSAIAKLSDDLASLKKQKKTLQDTAKEVKKVTTVTGTTKAGKKITKTVTVATDAAKKAAASLKNVNRSIDATQTALTKARRGDYSSTAKAAQKQLDAVNKQIEATDKALKAAKRGDYSSAALTAGTKAYNAYVAKGIKQLETYANKSDTLTSKLKDANTALTEAKKVRTEYISSLNESFAGTYGLSSESATTGIETIIRGFKNGAATVSTFATQFKQLKAKGLGQGLLDQIAQLGATDGSKVAKNLLTATDAQIKEITKQYNALNSKSSTASTSIGDDMYKTGVQAAQGLVKGLTAQLDKVTKASETLANKIIATVRKKLDIHSPSRVFKQIGVYTGAGMVEGIEQVTPDVQSAMSRLATPPSAFSGDFATGGGVGAGSGGVTITGGQFGYSPDEIGRGIIREQRKQEALYAR